MSYKLYNRIGSGGMVVEVALALAGAETELVDLDSRPGTPLPDSFRAVNPWGQVPTLILPDGSTVTECAAILAHVAACHPDRALAPAPGTPAHGQFLRWLVFASVNLYESALRRIYPHRYTSDPDGLEPVRQAAMARTRDALLVLENALVPGPFLLGEPLSLVDPYVAMLFTWVREPVATPRLQALTDRVKAHPVIAPVWRRHLGAR